MLNELLKKLDAGYGLSRGEAEDVMEELLAGRMNDDDIVRLLEALRSKGETVEELVGFATVMRRRANIAFARAAVHAEALVDTCGTGGGTVRTFNISTAAAFVVAGAGSHVAKHGNRSYTTSCGSADVLEALGVRIDAPPEDAAAAIDEIGIASGRQQYLICLARSRIRRGRARRCWAYSRQNGPSRWRWRLRNSAHAVLLWSMLMTGWTRSLSVAARKSLRCTASQCRHIASNPRSSASHVRQLTLWRAATRNRTRESFLKCLAALAARAGT